MLDLDKSKWQAIMDAAYEKWRTDRGMSYRTFLQSLNPTEQIAVRLGNLNYQVGNGGFRQWVDNGYALHGRDVMADLDMVRRHPGTAPEEAEVLKQLIEKIGYLLGYVNLNAEDRGFANYWYSNSRRAGSVFDDEGEDEDRMTEGAELADTYDTWYYDTFDSIGLPAVERFLASLPA